MFFPWCKPCFNSDADPVATWRQNRLKFLKAMRDNLETRLAAIDAAIATMEKQNSQEEA